jgi:hypothetical protein
MLITKKEEGARHPIMKSTQIVGEGRISTTGSDSHEPERQRL